MAVQWLTPAEKKKLKDLRKQGAQEEVERQVYGDPATVMSLKANMDTRSHAILDRMTKCRINVQRDRLEAIGGFSTEFGVIIAHLRTRPRTMTELTEIVATECSVTRAIAHRDTFALVSILKASDRAQRVGKYLELK